jgi:hypothetical protein
MIEVPTAILNTARAQSVANRSGSAAERGGVSGLDPEGVADGEDASRRVVERRSRVLLAAVAAGRPRDDDQRLPRAWPLTELDGERDSIADTLGQSSTAPRKQRIAGLRRPWEAISALSPT